MRVGKIVSDSSGLIVETVCFDEETGEIYLYELKTGEALVKSEPPADLLNPRWYKDKWVENASASEIEDYKIAKQKEKNKGAKPSVTDALAKEITKLKIESMKEKAVNTNLGKEVTRLKLGMMKLQGGKLQ